MNLKITKSLLSLLLALTMALSFSILPVYADEETTATSLPDADNGVITLTSNVTLNEIWEVSGTVTLDLAGYTLDLGANRITVASGASLTINDSSSENTGVVTSSDTSRTITVNGGTLMVNGGTIVNSATSGGWGCAAIAVFGTNDSTAKSYSTVNVNSGATLKTTGGSTTQPGYGVIVWPQNYSTYDCYGVTVNISGICTDAYMYVYGGITQSVSGVTFNITGATITGQYGIYAAGYAVWNISDTTINGGASGIEIRAGELNVKDSTITASSTETNTTVNWSGATVTGAAIAVSQHSTNQPITVNIEDSTISGYYGVLEVNCNTSSSADVSITISGNSTVRTTAAYDGGAAVYSETYGEENYNTTVSITGGTYSTDVSKYLAAGYTQDSDGNVVEPTYVAQIGDNYYTSLKAAFDAAEADNVITLLEDVTLSESLVYDNSVSATLELNGKTITFAYDENDQFNSETLSDGAWGLKVASGTLTIQDTSSAQTGGIKTADVNTYVDIVGASGDAVLNILSGNYYTNSTHEAVVFGTGNAVITISGGTFTNDAATYDYNSEFSGIILNIGNSSSATISVTGGTFYGENPASGDDNGTTNGTTTFVASGYEATETSDRTYTVASDKVAEINETGVVYSTLAEAVDAVSSGQTITLLKNVTLTDTIQIFKSITLELGDYTITSSASDKAIYTTQSLTINANDGGGITATNGAAINNQKGSGTGTLTINGGTYTSNAGHAIYNNNGTVIVNSGTIESTSTEERDGICCYDGGTVEVNGGEISGTRYGILSTSAVKINGGTISGVSVGVYLSTGTAEINGGEISGNEGLKGKGDVTSVVITDGTFTGVTHGVCVCNDSVTVSGGTFKATGSKAVYAVAFYIDGATVTFSGGTFSGMYSTAWIKSGSDGTISYATGYGPNTGTLTDTNLSETDPLERSVVLTDPAASIGSTEYATLEEAFAAASDGETITVLKNTTVDSQIVVSSTVTLDLNGYTVSRGSCENSALIKVTDGGDLTIEDSSDPSTGTIDGDALFTTSAGSAYAGIGLQITGGKATLKSGTITGLYGVYITGTSSEFEATGGNIVGAELSGNWSYGVYMANGADVTLSGDVNVSAITEDGGYGCGVGNFGGNADDATTLTIEDNAILCGSNYGISTNGSASTSNWCGNAVININGGSVTGGSWGMYLPAVDSVTNITGGEITGETTGIEIRAGTLNVSGGTITGNGTPSSFEFNGSGTTVIGAGIGISQHTTNQVITVNITGGEITGYYGVFEVNTNANNSSAVTLNISGESTKITGTDADAIYSVSISDIENASGYYTNNYTTFTVSGGSFSSVVKEAYCADGFVPTTDVDENGMYTVTAKTESGVLGLSNDSTGAAIVPATLDDSVTNAIFAEVSADYIGKYSTSVYPTYTDDNGKAYIFAGWYSYEEGEYSPMTSFPKDTAYAKLIDAKVLGVKGQLNSNFEITADYAALRFISSVDTLDYDKVGFSFTVNGTTKDWDTITVYETITGLDKTYTPSAQFCAAANFFFTYEIQEIPSNQFDTDIGVVPYWITMDGTTVYGSGGTLTVNNAAGVNG